VNKILNGIEGSSPASGPAYRCILTLVAKDSNIACGTAVLVGPRHAVTAAHCLMAEQPEMFLFQAVSGRRVRVVGVHFQTRASFSFGSGQPYPDLDGLTPDTDELTILELDSPLEGAAGLGTLAGGFRGNLGVATAIFDDHDGYVVIRAAMSLLSVSNDRIDMQQNGSRQGFASASGSALYLLLKSNELTVVGIESCTEDANAATRTVRQAHYLAFDASDLKWIDTMRARNPALVAPAAKIRAGASLSHFHVTNTDGADHTFGICLTEWGDLGDIDGKNFELRFAIGTLKLIRTGGSLHIQKTGLDSIRLSIAPPPGQSGAPVAVEMDIHSHPQASGRHWLKGNTLYGGQSVDVYLYKMDDDASDPTYPRQVYIDAYVVGGSYIWEIPELGTLESGCASANAKLRSLPGEFVRDLLQPFRAGGGFVQDDVGTGHEKP
jgi:hypothetical protein